MATRLSSGPRQGYLVGNATFQPETAGLLYALLPVTASGSHTAVDTRTTDGTVDEAPCVGCHGLVPTALQLVLPVHCDCGRRVYVHPRIRSPLPYPTAACNGAVLSAIPMAHRH